MDGYNRERITILSDGFLRYEFSVYISMIIYITMSFGFNPNGRIELSARVE